MSITVVTGASGHVGNTLVRALLGQGRRVRALIHAQAASLDGLNVERVDGDVLDPDSLARAFAGAEVVYHLAARISITGDQGGRVTAVNVEGTRNAARAALAAGARRFVHFSSVHAFDLEPLDTPIDEDAGRPGPKHPAYDRSKAAGEAALREVIAEGLDATIVNPTGVIGPNDHEPSRMGRLIGLIGRRKIPAMTPGGFDWVDVRDVAAAAIAAETRGRTGVNYLLGGEWLSMDDVAAHAARAHGVAPPRFRSPMWAARLGAPFVTLAAKMARAEPLYTSEALHAVRANRQIDCTRARTELGHRPRPAAESIADAVAWAKAHRGGAAAEARSA